MVAVFLLVLGQRDPRDGLSGGGLGRPQRPGTHPQHLPPRASPAAITPTTQRS
jgi:hypothetical protein